MVDVRDVHSLQFSFASKAKTLWSIDVEWKTLSFYSFNSSLNKNKGENVIAFIFKNELRHANPIYRVAIIDPNAFTFTVFKKERKQNNPAAVALLILSERTRWTLYIIRRNFRWKQNDTRRTVVIVVPTLSHQSPVFFSYFYIRLQNVKLPCQESYLRFFRVYAIAIRWTDLSFLF